MRHAALPLLLPLLAAAACGKKESEHGTPITIHKQTLANDAGAVMDLVPKDAALVVRIASSQKLNEITSLLGLALPVHTGRDALADITEIYGVDSSFADPTRPVLIAFRFPGGGERPVPVFILPASDPAAAAAQFKGGSQVSGGYVGLSPDKEYRGGNSPLAKGMMGGDISVRADLERIVEVLQKEIDEALTFPMPALDPTGVVQGMMDWAKEFVAQSDSIDATVTVKGGAIDLQVAYTVREEPASRGKAPVSELASLVPDGFPIVALLKVDMAGLNEFFLPVLEGLNVPPDQRKALQDLTVRQIELNKLLDGRWMMAMDFGADGFRAAMVTGSENAEAYVNGYVDTVTAEVTAEMGMAFRDEGTRKVGGTTVRRLRLEFDFEKFGGMMGMEGATTLSQMGLNLNTLFGDKGMQVDLAARGGRVYMTMDPEGKLIGKLMETDDVPHDLDAVTKQIGDHYDLLVHVDMRGLMTGIGGLVDRVIPGMSIEFPKGPSIPVTLYGSLEGRVYRGGLTLDVLEIRELFDKAERPK